MTEIQQELHDMITQNILPDIEEYMNELFETIAAKKETEEDKNALREIQELHEEFKSMLEEIENDEIDDDECTEIFEEIKLMVEG